MCTSRYQCNTTAMTIVSHPSAYLLQLYKPQHHFPHLTLLRHPTLPKFPCAFYGYINNNNIIPHITWVIFFFIISDRSQVSLVLLVLSVLQAVAPCLVQPSTTGILPRPSTVISPVSPVLLSQGPYPSRLATWLLLFSCAFILGNIHVICTLPNNTTTTYIICDN
jgi:hypothetical protein